MKKRLFSLIIVFCLCISLLGSAVYAKDVSYKYIEPPTEVSDYASMLAALPEGESEPDDKDIIWIKHAKLTANLALEQGQSIATLGKLDIPSGVTLTIGEGASVEAEVEIQSGGSVIVSPGGVLATTMAGEDAVSNSGIIRIEKGGVLISQKGGQVVNNGSLVLDGVFYCNSYYDTEHGTAVPWFSNEGSLSGSGQIAVMKPFIGPGENAVSSTYASIEMTKAVKTEKSKNSGGANIDVYTQADSVEGLIEFNGNANIDGVFLSKDMSDQAAAGGARNRFETVSDLTVTKKLWLDEKTDLYVGSGSALTVDPQKLIHSERGNISVEPGGGKLVLGGASLLGGSGTDAVFVPSDNHIFLSAKSPDAAGADYYPHSSEWIYLLGSTTSKADSDIQNLGLVLIVDSSLTLGGDLTAGTVEMRDTLNLNGHSLTADYLSLGFAPGPGANPRCNITGSGTINVLEGASADNCTAFIPSGVTLNLVQFYPGNSKPGVIFYNRGRIAVKAGGGTVTAGNVPVTLIGGSGESAVIVPTGSGEYDCAFITSASYRSGQDWPADWLYLIGSGISNGGDISGFNYNYDNTSDDLTLIVDNGSSLAVADGKTLHVSSLEWRGSITGAVTANNIYYYNAPGDPTDNVSHNGGRKVYECLFDLNTGRGMADVYNHATTSGGSICLEDYFADEGLSYPPARASYSFGGWDVSSGWASVSGADLEAYAVTENNGRHYVAEPASFPVRLTARWTYQGGSTGSGGGAPAAVNETVTPTASEAESGSVSMNAAVSGSTATVDIAASEIDRIADSGSEKTDSLVIDLSGLSKPVSAVTIDSGTLDKIADAAADESKAPEAMTVKFAGCSVILDAEALESVTEQASGKTVTLSVDLNSSNMTQFQKDVVSQLENTIVLDVYISSGGQRISDFSGGNAEIEIPYKWNGEGVLRAAFIKTDGSIEIVPVSYENGVARIRTGHFSHYVVYTEEALPFKDVTDTAAYYYDAVKWALANKITAGTSDTAFSPDESCTRAQIITFLWRAAGMPEPEKTDNPFADVSADAYYCKAVLWATEKNITTGTSEKSFSPDAPCTRAQMVSFLHRYAGQPSKGSAAAFGDVSPSDYYYDAVLWAASEGITSGTSASVFSPDALCSRAQAVTFICRSMAK